MAIDDNTIYGFKGKQVKDVANRIKENAGDIAELETALGGKQDTLTTAQLAAVDSGITAEKVTKLDNIESGAEVNVQANWNESDTASDAYIQNKPTIPTVNNATLTIQKNSTSVGTFTANSATDTTINITVPVTAADVSALPASTKYAANLSLTIDSSTYVVTGQLKDQDGNNLGSAQTIDLPLESVVVSGSYDSTNKKIILTLQSGQTIDVPVGDLVSGLQTEITSSNKLSADLVDDSTTTNKFVTASDKTTWNGKQNALTAGPNITISGDTISATDTTYSDFSGATSGDAGTHGLVPAPASGETDKYLKSDGSWATVSQYSLPAATASTLGGVKIGANLSMDANDVLSATDTTYSPFTGTDGTTAGTMGLVPAPATTDAGKVLSASGSWMTPDSGIKTLTTADYNYPTNNPTMLSLDALTPGVYIVTPEDTSVNPAYNVRYNGRNTQIGGGGKLLIKINRGGSGKMAIAASAVGENTKLLDGQNSNTNGVIISSADVVDCLVSTNNAMPLSANQGRVLNERIGDLSTLTTTDKTSTVAAINELASTGASAFTTNEWNALWS